MGFDALYSSRGSHLHLGLQERNFEFHGNRQSYLKRNLVLAIDELVHSADALLLEQPLLRSSSGANLSRPKEPLHNSQNLISTLANESCLGD